jgi:NAD(P)-dependent dehydrogenase (short-subunit alcohol dehydrogenase family)
VDNSRGAIAYANLKLKSKDSIVIATARDTAKSSGLQELKSQDKSGQLVLIDLDVSKPESIHAAAEKTMQISPGGLDHLISNAGVAYTGMKTFEEL